MIVYYISAHGFGHAARSLEVLRHLPQDVPLLVKTGVPRWFFEQELAGHQWEHVAAEFDCGMVQQDGMRVDVARTMELYRRICRKNQRRFAAEAAWLRESGARVVVSDTASFPLAVAKEAAVPGVALGNFTWHDIYEPVIGENPAYRDVMEILREEYSCATLSLLTQPHLAMSALPHQVSTPVITRAGRSIREELCRELEIDPASRLFLIYVGKQGLDGVDWKRLERMAGVEFLTLHNIAEGVSNLHVLPSARWHHPDITASVEAVIGKPGYGIVGECLGNGTPLIYTSREQFAEYDVLHDALQRWGAGVFLPPERFAALDWAGSLQGLDRLPRRDVFALNGAEFCADRIMQLYRK